MKKNLLSLIVFLIISMNSLSNMFGCDSIATLNLTINTVNSTISQNGIILSADENGAIYQWIDCNNNNFHITNETNQSFTPTNNGNYAVIIDNGNCFDTSECVVINTISLSEQSELNHLVVYPNPTNGIIHCTLDKYSDEIEITILNSLGQQVKRISFNESSFNIDLRDLSKGFYTLQFSMEQNKVITRKIVLN